MVADFMSYCVIGNSGGVQSMFNFRFGTSAISCYFDNVVCNNTAWKHLFVACIMQRFIVYNARGYNIRIICVTVVSDNIIIDTDTYMMKSFGEYPVTDVSEIKKQVKLVAKDTWMNVEKFDF